MLKPFGTQRLLLRPIEARDAQGMFAMDSNPRVHRFLGNRTVTTLEESRDWIANIQQQYRDNGIGRWAVIEKKSGEFIGWCGLKLERNVNGRESFYDFGYRFREEFWGQGFATEAGKAWIDAAFNILGLEVVNAYASAAHKDSRAVLEKCGLLHTEDFLYEGEPEVWYELRRPNP